MIEKILIVDDEPIIRHFLKDVFAAKGKSVRIAEEGEAAIEMLAKEPFDLVITDMVMPKSSGIDVLKYCKRKTSALVIIMTAFGSIENAVEAMQEGAFHYLIKPFTLEAIEAIFEKAEEHTTLVSENRYLKKEISFFAGEKRQKVVAESPLMQKVLRDIEKVAKTNASVFINGESGTGKEVVASCLHHHSLRKEQPFIRVNCAAVPETLIESEFFGHERGSFTGANLRRMGRFELANKGTLLLDEVTEIPIQLQPKLLRAIQEQEFERVGSEKSVKVDVRIIATSNRNMSEAIADKIFREDLYYRLNVVPIEIPPLRKRKEDILPLAEYFLEVFSEENHKKKKRFTEDAKKKLLSYTFPGNVRELANIIERIVVLEAEDKIFPSHLPFQSETKEPSCTLAHLEKRHILETLQKLGGNRTRAAKELGISVRTLRNKINLYR